MSHKTVNCMCIIILIILICVFKEILIAKHIEIGGSDTVNVQELLYQDFLDILRHIQVNDMIYLLTEYLIRAFCFLLLQHFFVFYIYIQQMWI